MEIGSGTQPRVCRLTSVRRWCRMQRQGMKNMLIHGGKYANSAQRNESGGNAALRFSIRGSGVSCCGTAARDSQ